MGFEHLSSYSLGLASFQINPHYLDADSNSTHMGETREKRIQEFLEENETPVVGLREGCMTHVQDGVHLFKGQNERIFRRGLEPVELEPGNALDGLIQYGAWDAKDCLVVNSSRLTEIGHTEVQALMRTSNGATTIKTSVLT